MCHLKRSNPSCRCSSAEEMRLPEQHNSKNCLNEFRCHIELFQFRTFTRLKQIQHLIQTGQVDQELFLVLRIRIFEPRVREKADCSDL